MSAIRAFRSSTALFAGTRCMTHPARACNPRLLHLRQYSQNSASEASSSEAQPNSSSSAETSPDSLTPEQKKLAQKEAEVVDLTSRLRYLQADFLNLQRNAAREKEQTKDFAVSRFAGDLLEVVDVLSLAVKSVPSSALPSSEQTTPSPASSGESAEKTPQAYLGELHTGVEMTQRLLLQVLFKYHVKPFDPLGDAFDPNKHEALYQAPIPDKKPGSVIDVQKVGYMIKDRVLRAAQVGVAQ